MKFPEKYRVTYKTLTRFPTLAGLVSDSSYGNSGAAIIPNGKGSELFIIAADGEGWDHVSVTVIGRDRCPNWEEMCFVKELFWSEEECVIQYHPPASEYVSQHPFCLHLWKPQGIELPLPPKIMVGTILKQKA